MSNRSVKLFRMGICGSGALKRYHLKIFLSRTFSRLYCLAEWNHLYNFIEVITENNSVKLFLIWTSGSWTHCKEQRRTGTVCEQIVIEEIFK